ncbi:MAG: PIG-L family deacetylase [Haliscomenobacter sp.]|nr:PIG-L family deacetylase [Haliscomenobacter sp.]
MRKVVVISAHPDDETLGVGGTLLKHKEAGDQLCWIIVTGISESAGFTKARVESRSLEIDKVSSKYGFIKTFKLDYSTMSLSSKDLTTLIPNISKIFNEIKPEIVYTMNRSDAHSDHRVIFNAVISCTKSFRYPYIKQVLMYECLSETEFAAALPENVFIPNYYVDISLFIEQKLNIMEIFESELGAHPFPRSLENIRALAHYRGATVGVQFAEAFQLLKFIDK